MTMFEPLLRLFARLIGVTGRTLWTGTLTSKFTTLFAIAFVVVLLTQAGTPAIAELAPLLLVMAFFVVVYSLVLRGR